MSDLSRETSERSACAGRLLAEAGFGDAFELVAVQGGANAKAFRVEFAAGAPPLFFKEYFHHPDDPRDRLGTEFAFASFAWNQGLRSLARPYGMKREERCALYAFLEGNKLEPHEVSRAAIHQCLQFYRAINACKSSPQASHLPAASEACFCLLDHWKCLDRRIQRLERLTPQSAIDEEALRFVRDELTPACAEHLSEAKRSAAALRISPQTPLPTSDRCLSPSDFGFHNTLRASDGSLRFLDFEYAGWDDPAKTVCDFFCQPAYPAPLECYDEFADAVAAPLSDPALHRRRFDLLLPLYQLKWCCIMLNDFLPSGASRRRFAMQEIHETSRKSNQLQKALLALERYRLGRSSRRAA